MSIEQETEVMRRIPIFRKIDVALLKLLCFSSERLTFQQDQMIFGAGEPGDAVLAIFNVPIPDKEHAAHALSAAIEMVQATESREFAGVRVHNRIGISTGQVYAGAVGSRGRRTYTVHGNTVNLASRIEALNKDYGTRILLSGKTAERCPDIRLRQVAEVTIRGYSDTVTLHTPELRVTRIPRAASSA